jgi:hypothetical protein
VVWDNEHILHSTTPVALYDGGQVIHAHPVISCTLR